MTSKSKVQFVCNGPNCSRCITGGNFCGVCHRKLPPRMQSVIARHNAHFKTSVSHKEYRATVAAAIRYLGRNNGPAE